MDIKQMIADGVRDGFANLGRGGKNAPPPEERDADTSALHPVLSAALAAGLDTPEKLAGKLAQAKAGEAALLEAREDCKKASVAFFGQENQGAIEGAAAWAESCQDYGLLRATADRYWSGAPGAERPNQRQSVSTAPAGEALKRQEQAASDAAFKPTPIDVAAAYAPFRGTGRSGKE